jgi:simple sugar transport system permease protein
MLAGLVVALAVGFANGLVVTRTRLPSFIVTLGTFLMLQGLNLGVTKDNAEQVAKLAEAGTR